MVEDIVDYIYRTVQMIGFFFFFFTKEKKSLSEKEKMLFISLFSFSIVFLNAIRPQSR